MKNLWNDRRGAGLIPAIGLAFVLLLAGAAIIEALRLQSTAKAVRDAVQAATVETCEEQYGDIYDGAREGYSGGYVRKSGGSWSEALSPADLYARLDTNLGTREDGGERIKYAGSDVNYRLSGLSARITNAPFAPSADSDQLTCTAEIDLEIPLMLNWDGVPPMRIHLNVKGGYMPKF